MNKKSLIKFLSFENERFIFPAVHHAFKFCLLMASGLKRPQNDAHFIFFARYIEDVKNPERLFTLASTDIALLNPNTRTAPVFRTNRDAIITKGVHCRMPVLLNEATGESPWDIFFMRMFDMSTDSALFRTAEQLEADGWQLDGNHYYQGETQMLPLYEAKMTGFWNHRAADVVINPAAMQRQSQSSYITPTQLLDPARLALPNYWIREQIVKDRLNTAAPRGVSWLFGFRDITSPTNERTFAPAILPIAGVGHKMPLIFSNNNNLIQGLIGNLNCYALDYIARQKVGGTSMTYHYVKQFPVIPPSTFTTEHLVFITPRVLELTYTAHDLAGFAHDLGYDGPPFVWDDERRFWLRAELDALYFHLYGITRDDVDYIMDTFPIVKRKDEAKYGTYRTKEAILSIYDELARVGVENYQPRLPIPPADPRAAHGAPDGQLDTIIYHPEVEHEPLWKKAITLSITHHGRDSLRRPEEQLRVMKVASFSEARTVEDILLMIEDHVQV